MRWCTICEQPGAWGSHLPHPRKGFQNEVWMTLLPPLHTDTPPHHSPALWEGPREGSPMWPAPPAAWTGNFWSFHAGGSWDPVADDGGISEDGCAAAGSWRSFGRDRQQLRGSELLLVTCRHCPPPAPPGFLCSGRPPGRLRGPCAQWVFQAHLGSLRGTSAKTDGGVGVDDGLVEGPTRSLTSNSCWTLAASTAIKISALPPQLREKVSA